MRRSSLILYLCVFCAAVHAADEQLLALSAQAEGAFSRVVTAPLPGLRETSACVQVEAAMLPVASPEILPQVHFRKGFCMLAEASLTGTASEFSTAANELGKAVESWSARPAVKNRLPEAVPTAWVVLSAVARLHAGPDPRALEEIRAAAENCDSAFTPEHVCRMAFRLGREWLASVALRDGNLAEAARTVAADADSGWREWIAGRVAFEKAEYRQAAARYRHAIDLLNDAEAASLAARLGPPRDRPAELAELGGAQMLAGESAAAIATLDTAVRSDPTGPRALYLRARAKEATGQDAAAIADYNLASRTAFAGAKDLASGEAHLYRGIVLYRRKDYTHAEDEFASALNFTISPEMRADAVAWRHLAAVSGGSCEASRKLLERSITAASPFFPGEEARRAIAGCTTSAVSGQAK